MKSIRICPVCGEMFKYNPSEKRITCSRECYYKRRWGGKRLIEMRCKNCGNIFKNYKSNKSIYCSKRCQNISQIGKKRSPETCKKLSKSKKGNKSPKSYSFGNGKDNPNWKGGLPKCIICGKRLSGYTSKRCANCECKHATGKNAHHWKSGLLPTNKRIRQSKNYAVWRSIVFERDNYTCQRCHQIGGELQAHHILHFKDYPLNRLDIDNGITLCKKCHNLKHSRTNKIQKYVFCIMPIKVNFLEGS